jgi:hypothetical protein
MKPYYIAHVDSEGRDEEQVRAYFRFHQRPVEVHGPKLGLKLNRRKLSVGPLRQEVC